MNLIKNVKEKWKTLINKNLIKNILIYKARKLNLMLCDMVVKLINESDFTEVEDFLLTL